MATYVRGNAVENATSYELLEKVGSSYNSLAVGDEINFEVSALGLAVGDHTLVVKAKADGYIDSDYSNEVIFAGAGEVWYTSAALLPNTPPAVVSMSGPCATYYKEETHNKYRNKTVNRLQVYCATPGTLTVYKLNSIATGATGTKIATITMPSVGWGVYEIPNTVVGDNEYIGIYDPASDTGKFGYWNVASDYSAIEDKGMVLMMVSGSLASSDKGGIGFNLGYGS